MHVGAVDDEWSQRHGNDTFLFIDLVGLAEPHDGALTIARLEPNNVEKCDGIGPLLHVRRQIFIRDRDEKLSEPSVWMCVCARRTHKKALRGDVLALQYVLIPDSDHWTSPSILSVAVISRGLARYYIVTFAVANCARAYKEVVR